MDKVLNLSTRVEVQAGTNVGIGGFIITGTDPKIGRHSCKGAVPDPTLAALAPCRSGLGAANSTQAVIATNDDWMDNSDEDQQLLIDHGLAPTSDLESAIIKTLDPGL